MAMDMSRFIKRFVSEARDHIETINKGLAAFEEGKGDADLINSVFRSAHTIKGTSRMIKLLSISEMAHGMENIFGLVREGRMTVDADVAEVLYRGIDWIAAQVEIAAEGGAVVDVDQELIAQMAEVFNRINQGGDASQTGAPASGEEQGTVAPSE
ncbi:MAG: Hpt domain-containing protein, partial [Magnetococcales bacterium]|nr:Hpt domain-containing protein [Magnetococcales bacterium]